MKTIFSLEMNEKIHLIKPESVYDQILYILEVWQGGVPFELRIQTVSETTSEARFQRLILRQKFEEAKEVARIFNLDLSDVRKGEAQMIVDKMRCDEDDINNLINILDTIDDDEFKIMCCCNVHESCSNLKDVEKVLLYCNEIDVNESMEVFIYNYYVVLLVLKFVLFSRHSVFSIFAKIPFQVYCIDLIHI